MDASPDEAHGFFFRDTRFLSRWLLTVDGARPRVLSRDETQYFAAQFFLTVPGRNTVSLIRQRLIGDGIHEDVTVLNHDAGPLELTLRLEAASDFADLFEVKDALEKKGEGYSRVDGETLVLGYRRDDFGRETVIRSSKPAAIDENGLTLEVRVEPHGEWNTCLFIQPVTEDGPIAIKHRHGDERARPNIGVSLEEFVASAPALESDWDPLEHVYDRSLVDLAALRFESPLFPGAALPAAGLPWFMTVFGRDSLITSFQALPFTPELAATTLRVLAARQATEDDPFRDAEPGKILHEIRFGELTRFGERPHSPYYGSADSTPLFLVLLDEYERWSGDVELVRGLETNALAALEWIDARGEYVAYERRNTENGLENQCWKDSGDSIRFADGRIARGPIAACEVQGYAYDAKVRCARLAREVWRDDDLAARLEREAAELRDRFDRDFWLSERDFYAEALDGEGRRVDSITSNPGHLLWSGIVPRERAGAVAARLMSDELFSGWGVRTMAEGEGAYNPIRYHNGTVWPHDNSLIALGLARYGFRDEANRIATALIEAAARFRYRLPEVFAGYRRTRTGFPVEYPTASSPQAWATGAPFVFLRTMLGLEPEASRLRSDPMLPPEVSRLELRGTPFRGERVDVTSTREEALR